METLLDYSEHAHSSLARQHVIADLRSLLRDTEELLKATADDVSEKAKEVRVRVSAAVERARATCDDLHEQTAATARAAAQKADTVIREHPYETLGIALGVGLLVGVLIGRKYHVCTRVNIRRAIG